MKVFAVHGVYGSGDYVTEFFLLALCKTLERAKKEAFNLFEQNYSKEKLDPINKKMTKENGYIFVGKTEEADETTGCNYDHFGGFVIEETEILE